jgi:hypothetical protein
MHNLSFLDKFKVAPTYIPLFKILKWLKAEAFGKPVVP